MKQWRIFFFLYLLTVALMCVIAARAQGQTPDSAYFCHVTGTVEKKLSGAPAANLRIKVVRVVKAGFPTITAAEYITTNSNGEVDFYMRRGATACFYAEHEGLNRNAATGTCFTIPDATTGDWNALVPVSAPPSTVALPALSAANNGKYLRIVDGVITAATVSGGGGGSGTVESFTAGNLSPLFTSSVANGTTTPALTFSLSSQSANRIFAGPTTGSAAVPTFRALVAADIPALAISGVTGLQTALDGKQATLVSGTSIKTINGTSLLGSGDITISGGGSPSWGSITGTLSSQTDLQSALDAKQAADADLTTYAGITPSANVQTLLGSANFAAFKTSLSLNNVENTALSTWAGTTNITTLGTVATGTWQGSVIGASYGGAGTVSGILKANGSGTVSAASAGTDYVAVAANVNAQAGTTYTLQASDNGKVITISNSGAITVTVPTGLGAGFNCLIVQLGTGQITISASSTTIYNRQSHTKTAGQYATVSLVSHTANTFILGGDTAS